MNPFRKILFWTHLVAGLTAGVIIFVMSITGVALAFEDELVAWAERDARRVDAPASGTRLSLDTLHAQFVRTHPDRKPTGLTLSSDPAAAATLNIGRSEVYYINPYTGDIRQPASSAMHDFMRTMIVWHRWLGQEGDGRAVGKAITGASNLAFIVLTITGLVIWWPAALRWPVLRRSLVFIRTESTKARDWNWHNTLGFWFLIPIFVMAVTATVFSYRWAGEFIYRVVGEEPPVRGGPRAGNAPEPQRSTAAGLEDIFIATQNAFPNWNSISLGLPVRAVAEAQIKLPGAWPRTATTTATIDPASLTVTGVSDFSDQSAGRQIRGWVRYLHTGQALGWLGQLVAGLGCLAGCFLVYTGFALSWRRFFGRKSAAA